MKIEAKIIITALLKFKRTQMKNVTAVFDILKLLSFFGEPFKSRKSMDVNKSKSKFIFSLSIFFNILKV